MHGDVVERTWDSELKFNPERVSVYKDGAYTGWVKKSSYMSARRDADAVTRKAPSGRSHVEWRGSTLRKSVTITEKGEKQRYDYEVVAYTRTQRKMVADSISKRRIPVSSRGPKTLTKLSRAFNFAGIRKLSFARHDDTP